MFFVQAGNVSDHTGRSWVRAPSAPSPAPAPPKLPWCCGCLRAQRQTLAGPPAGGAQATPRPGWLTRTWGWRVMCALGPQRQAKKRCVRTTGPPSSYAGSPAQSQLWRAGCAHQAADSVPKLQLCSALQTDCRWRPVSAAQQAACASAPAAARKPGVLAARVGCLSPAARRRRALGARRSRRGRQREALRAAAAAGAAHRAPHMQ